MHPTMAASMSSLLMVCLGLAVMDTSHGYDHSLGESPLPRITEFKRKYRPNNSTDIQVHYNSNQKPHGQWYIDDIPFIGGSGNYFMRTFYSGGFLDYSNLIVESSLGSRFALCLQTTTGRTCIHFRPRDRFTITEVTMNLPWPLLVPAPLARYYTGHQARVFAPELSALGYTYSARFLYLVPGNSTLQAAESNGMEGGEADDIVTMAPVTSGSPGWMVRIPTDSVGYEGVLLFETTFTPPKPAVEKCISTRPLEIYDRSHSAPYPDNYLAFLPNPDGQRTIRCRANIQLYCLISVPFVYNGDIEDVQLNLSQVNGDGTTEHMEVESRVAQTWKLGRYMAEARFQLEGYADGVSRTYDCSLSLSNNVVTTRVVVTQV